MDFPIPDCPKYAKNLPMESNISCFNEFINDSLFLFLYNTKGLFL